MRLRSVAVAMSAAAVMTLLPSAAQASQSGPGWSATWQYTNPTTVTMQMTRPGAQLSGSAIDMSGDRSGLISVWDTSAFDGRCAVARVVEVDDNFLTVGTRIVQACNQIVTVPFASPHELDIDLCDHVPVGVDGTCTAMVIENTGPDPSLRSTGTGVSWHYLPLPLLRNNFAFWLQRPGVRIDGSGHRDTTTWTAHAWLDTTLNPLPWCASGQFNKSDGADLGLQTCQRTRIAFGSLTTQVGFSVRACQELTIASPPVRRCLYSPIA